MPLAIRSDNGLPSPAPTVSAFISEFNAERPHEAIDMKAPAALDTPSSTAYEGLPGLDHPLHDREILVTACGRICMNRKNQPLHRARRPEVRIKEVDRACLGPDAGHLARQLHALPFGYMDLEQRTLQTIDNPFGTRLSPMS